MDCLIKSALNIRKNIFTAPFLVLTFALQVSGWIGATWEFTVDYMVTSCPNPPNGWCGFAKSLRSYEVLNAKDTLGDRTYLFKNTQKVLVHHQYEDDGYQKQSDTIFESEYTPPKDIKVPDTLITDPNQLFQLGVGYGMVGKQFPEGVFIKTFETDSAGDSLIVFDLQLKTPVGGSSEIYKYTVNGDAFVYYSYKQTWYGQISPPIEYRLNRYTSSIRSSKGLKFKLSSKQIKERVNPFYLDGFQLNGRIVKKGESIR